MDIKLFHSLCTRKTSKADYPLAADVAKNILIYEEPTFSAVFNDKNREAELKNELGAALRDGPGIFVVKNAYPDTDVIDRCTELFRNIVADELAAGKGHGDHFGSNQRIWNSLQKISTKDPELFIDYFGNPVIAIAAQAWLGPFYQMTAQMNNVRPGSAEQLVHRDYHLGFQSADTVPRFPPHVQIMSQYLTLQGAIAHVDMPLESGPTLLLPFSQLFESGYMAYGLPEFQQYFGDHRVQLPLEKGDMVFFSPAVFHAAGSNQSTSDRIVNLLQISSAFGRTMETINKESIVEAIYPVLHRRQNEGSISGRKLLDAVSAAGDGYSFPTNLDSDPPVGGNAPESGQELLLRALKEKMTPSRLKEEMDAYARRREA